MMHWSEKELLLTSNMFPHWGKKSAMLPTPIQLSKEIVRVYTTFCNEKGIGRIGYFDVNPQNPHKVLAVSTTPCLNIGEPGTFDDNGVAACSVIKVGQLYYMYYAGFEICTKIRYRILTGLAISKDGGKTFQRHSSAPILERSNVEMFFRCGPFVRYENSTYKMWYIGGSQWVDLNGKKMPRYDMRYIESKNGIDWPDCGEVVMAVSDPNEHGFGRPYIIISPESKKYKLHYSIRKISDAAYRLGYATSNNGKNWHRQDALLNLDVSAQGFDSNAIMFAAPISFNNNTYLFYNGNEFGKDGVAIVCSLNK